MSQSGFLSATSAPGIILNLEGDTGGVIGPNGSGIIFIKGGVGVTVDGTAGTFTLEVNTLGTEAIVQTVDDTPTVIFTQTLNASEAAYMEVKVISAQDDYTSAIGGSFSATIRRAAAGGAVCSGGPHGNILEDTAGMPDVNFNPSGNDIQVLVTGVAATTYNWRAFIRVTFDN